MKHMRFLAGTALAIGLAAAAPAQAAPYLFKITGSASFTFTLNSSPIPDTGATGGFFTLYDNPGFPSAAIGLADVTFFNAASGGGLEIDDYYGNTVLLSTDGPQLYTGTEAAPTFKLGTFALTQYLGTGTYSLTIAPVATASVPEPASWGMMIVGFGAVGGAMRYRRRATKIAFA